MKYVLLSIAALIAGCATPTVSDLRSPDGRAMKNVKCNIDAQKCLVLASETCKEQGGTYQVVRSHSNAGGTAADVLPGPVTWYNMTFICGPSDGRMPDFAFQGPRYDPGPDIVYQPQRPLRTSCSTIGGITNCTTR